MPAKNKTSVSHKIRKVVKYAIFATNVIAIALLLATRLAWTVKPSETTFFSYLGLSFIFIFALNIMYLFFWMILLKWKLAAVELIALVLCWSMISTYIPIHFKTKEIPADSFKILSYNVKAFNWVKGKDVKDNPMLTYIALSGADIICMQEVVVDDNPKGTNIITRKDLNAIFKDYPYHSVERVGTKTSYTYGIACYSKFPITSVTKLPIWSSSNGSIKYEIEIKGKKVTLINNHLESNRITAADKKLYKQLFKTKDSEKLDEVAHNIQSRLGIAFKIRESQANTIKDVIANDTNDAVIVCGDFNDTPISYTYKTVKGDLIDSYASSGLGQGITYHENKFWFRIDYIMHSPNIKSYNCAVDNTIKYSDHYPVSTYLKFE